MIVLFIYLCHLRSKDYLRNVSIVDLCRVFTWRSRDTNTPVICLAAFVLSRLYVAESYAPKSLIIGEQELNGARSQLPGWWQNSDHDSLCIFVYGWGLQVTEPRGIQALGCVRGGRLLLQGDAVFAEAAAAQWGRRDWYGNLQRLEQEDSLGETTATSIGTWLA